MWRVWACYEKFLIIRRKKKIKRRAKYESIKKEMMNRALSAMTMNIGKKLVLMTMSLKKSNANLKLMKLLNLNLQKISLKIKMII